MIALCVFILINYMYFIADNYHKSSTIISPQPTFLSILSDKVLAAGELLGYSVFNDISVVHGTYCNVSLIDLNYALLIFSLRR